MALWDSAKMYNIYLLLFTLKNEVRYRNNGDNCQRVSWDQAEIKLIVTMPLSLRITSMQNAAKDLKNQNLQLNVHIKIYLII